MIILEKSSFIPPYGDFLYDFSFFPLAAKEKRNKDQNGFDHKIHLTLLNFLEDLFSQDVRNTIVYICDSQDQREFYRKILFDKWYNEFSIERFEKLDFKLVNDGSDYLITTYISIVTLRENPHLDDLKDFTKSNMEEFENYKFE
ncbi:DUF6169 family protein [Belliella pelovolcani]|uniref:Uncharacterized protein n=1 Tax=Belliella pelovolcani TaxID=529505 RepID=A0A1N7KVI2_9BACT|nr:DUF6169 family protein [Belliella pelovolcani]SIS65547.1 hypothetical protein SAMN05421761_102374 [Belliella pelovolcani]